MIVSLFKADFRIKTLLILKNTCIKDLASMIMYSLSVAPFTSATRVVAHQLDQKLSSSSQAKVSELRLSATAHVFKRISHLTYIHLFNNPADSLYRVATIFASLHRPLLADTETP